MKQDNAGSTIWVSIWIPIIVSLVYVIITGVVYNYDKKHDEVCEERVQYLEDQLSKAHSAEDQCEDSRKLDDKNYTRLLREAREVCGDGYPTPEEVHEVLRVRANQ